MSPRSSQLIGCRVIDGGKLPVDSGGPGLLCAEIRRAAAASPMAGRFKVQVRVLGRSSLSATLTTEKGKVLPEQKFVINDRALTRGSLERFAKALVSEVERVSSH